MLKGQINRHKNHQELPANYSGVHKHSSNFVSSNCMMQIVVATHKVARNANYYQASSTTPVIGRAFRGTYSARGHRRGGRGGQVHRNRTLVMNSATSLTPTTKNDDVQGDLSIPVNANGNPSWVTRSDRHLQLINPAIYEKETQKRAQAIEETRQHKLRQKDEKERLKLSRHLGRLDASNARTATATTSHDIQIEGVWFRVAKNGSKLAKLPGMLLHPLLHISKLTERTSRRNQCHADTQDCNCGWCAILQKQKRESLPIRSRQGSTVRKPPHPTDMWFLAIEY